MEEVNIQKEEIEEQEVGRLLYFDRPSLMDRLKSTTIDGVVVILLMLLASQLMTSLQVDSGIVRGMVLAALLLYEPTLTALHKTIGQLIIGLRVRDHHAFSKDGTKKNIHFFRAVIRFIFKAMLGWISLLTISSDPYGRAIHDSAADSVMMND